MDDGTEPIADEELLYRRVPASTEWYSSIGDIGQRHGLCPDRIDQVGMDMHTMNHTWTLRLNELVGLLDGT